MEFPGPRGIRQLARAKARALAGRWLSQGGAAAEAQAPPPEAVPEPSAALQAVLRASCGTNGSELHLLLAAFKWLREAALRNGHTFEGEVLEIGGYDHPGFPLTLLLLGAERVHLNNVVSVHNRLPRSYAETVYALLNGFSVGMKRRLDDVVRPLPGSPDCVEVLPELLNVISSTDAAELDLPAGSLNCVFSMAVFEHIRDPEQVIANTFRMLGQGGWCFHAIDLRDHRDFSRPLDFLALSEDEFRAFNPHDSRLRGQDYVERFEAAGFEIQEAHYCAPLPVREGGGTDTLDMLLDPPGTLFRPLEQIDVWVSEEQRRGFDPRFRGYSLAELSATGVGLVARKPA